MKYSFFLLFLGMNAFGEVERKTHCYQEKESSYRRTLITEDGKFFFEETEYLYRDCKVPLYVESLAGSYTESERDYEATVEIVTWMALAEDYAELMNIDADCGFSDWKVGEAKSIDRLSCNAMPDVGDSFSVKR